MILLIETIEELIEKCDEHFPINNSTIPLLILIKTIRYELAGETLSLKAMCTELNSSELCARSHIAKLEKNGWLEVKVSHMDRRVKLIKSSKRLKDTIIQLVNSLNPTIHSLINESNESNNSFLMPRHVSKND